MMFLAVFVCLILCIQQTQAFKIAVPMKSRHAMSKIAMVTSAAASKDNKVKKEVKTKTFAHMI